MNGRSLIQWGGTIAAIVGMTMLNAEWGPQGTAIYMVVAGCWCQFYGGRNR